MVGKAGPHGLTGSQTHLRQGLMLTEGKRVWKRKRGVSVECGSPDLGLAIHVVFRVSGFPELCALPILPFGKMFLKERKLPLGSGSLWIPVKAWGGEAHKQICIVRRPFHWRMEMDRKTRICV